MNLTKREQLLWDWLIKALSVSSDWPKEQIEQYVEIQFNKETNGNEE